MSVCGRFLCVCSLTLREEKQQTVWIFFLEKIETEISRTVQVIALLTRHNPALPFSPAENATLV